ncbi:MAG: Bax inhibitor-1/YccA family protein [Candidatus Dadabacteria bacterium]|nr:MAG: Bax inhibitor-1/YccA family protein [Candidatus Dadabacteria bacterium]
MRTANPALNDKVFGRYAPRAIGASEVMTLDGTVNKALLSACITMGAAWWSFANPPMASMALPLALIAFVVGIVLSFKKEWASVLTPVYALLEGLFLGSISLMFESIYPGIVFQAVSYTFGTLFALLLVYKSRLIPVTQNFRLGVAAATGGIAFVYLLSMVFSLFGVPFTFLSSASPLSIGISIVVIIVAALNLVLDFDFIEQGAARGDLPKYMEWYAAFGLLVTLVWLYLEILRLLVKLQSRD